MFSIKSARSIVKRGICLAMSVLMLSFVPAIKSEAAEVELGIDVSKYQGQINWTAVAASGVKFAFIKVGSLKSGLDPYFYYNMQAAAANGIKTGVYIYSYATSVADVAVEAQFVLAALANVDVSYPVAWDVEDSVQKSIDKTTLTLMANTFCALIEQGGYTPIVYANKYWFTEKLGTINYDKWAAQWNNTVCEVPGFTIWQYSCKGQIAGISGDVDLNFSIKDYSEVIIKEGLVLRQGKLYYYKDYQKQIGLQNIAGLTFFFNADGSMYYGWLNDGVNSMYFDTTDGHMVTGLVTLSDGAYYFDANGIMQTGIVEIAGAPYLFDTNGRLVLTQ